MRQYASVLLRLGDRERAEDEVKQSMALAASRNHPDFVSYAREMKAKVFLLRHGAEEAVGPYLICLQEAQRYGMLRLEAEALLGLARCMLKIGDPSAAYDRAIEALKIANTCLLRLVQVRALLILGESSLRRGESVGRAYLESARDLAAACEFRLAERDVEERLAADRLGQPPPAQT